MAQTFDPGQQRTVESGNAAGAATTKRDAQESAAGKIRGEFDLPGDSTRDRTASAHQPVHTENPKLVDRRQKHVDSGEACRTANPDRKAATEVQLTAVPHFIVELPVPGVTHGDDSQCERSAQNPLAVATDALPETRTRESAALPPPARTNVFVGVEAGISSGTADESATLMAANDEFVGASSKGGKDHDASKVADSRSAPGSEENQEIPTVNGAPPADVSRVVSPAFPGLFSAHVMQSAQWSKPSVQMKGAPGHFFNSRTIRTATGAAALAGFPSEKGPLSIATHGEMSAVQLRNAAASNGSGEQTAASAAGLARSPVTDTNGRPVEDPFAAIDADRSSAATTWMHAGPRHAEAGYLDPSLGWVGVRADVSASGIHAAVVPGSAEAAQALGGHISGLSAYMAEHHGHAATVTLESPQYRSDGTGEDPQPGSGDAGTERHFAGGDRADQRSTGAGERRQERNVSLAEPISGAMTIAGQRSANVGRYVSVVA
jgi:hypothetical protein